MINIIRKTLLLSAVAVTIACGGSAPFAEGSSLIEPSGTDVTSDTPLCPPVGTAPDDPNNPCKLFVL